MSRCPRGTPLSANLVLTSPTSGSRSVGIFRRGIRPRSLFVRFFLVVLCSWDHHVSIAILLLICFFISCPPFYIFFLPMCLMLSSWSLSYWHIHYFATRLRTMVKQTVCCLQSCKDYVNAVNPTRWAPSPPFVSGLWAGAVDMCSDASHMKAQETIMRQDAGATAGWFTCCAAPWPCLFTPRTIDVTSPDPPRLDFTWTVSHWLVVKALSYEPDGRGFETRWGDIFKFT
jgi:hypothetical protein